MKKLYRGSYIDASCQVWFNLAKEFQRRRFFNISQSETIIALDNPPSNALLYQVASFRPVNKYGRQGQFLFLIGYC
jgi:hypothetical protein